MTEDRWNKWSKDIMEITSGIPPVKSRSNLLPQVLIMVGIPGNFLVSGILE